jgi:hypothetical protein
LVGSRQARSIGSILHKAALCVNQPTIDRQTDRHEEEEREEGDGDQGLALVVMR